MLKPNSILRKMIQENISLKAYNTFGVEARARFFAEISSEEKLLLVLNQMKTEKEGQELPLLILGGGSNILLTKNFDGLVIKLNLKGITEELIGDNETIVTAKAGENWHQFVLYTLSKNYGGLENLSLIPGNVGTSPIQNIGAYGVEIKDSFLSCKVLNLETLQIETLSKEDCQFGYRDSIFKREAKGKYIILEVSFRLTTQNHNIRMEYGAIRSELSAMGIETPSIQQVSEAVIRIRESKLPNPKVLGNAGSFFKNPIISTNHYRALQKTYLEISGYENGEQTKVPAGWLIEKAGWKGKQLGNVACHHLQALVIVNKTGNATGEEIYSFSQEIINSVKEKFEIELEREVNII